MKQLTIENFKAMLDNALKNIKEREDEFSKLDAVIGDGDHGQAIVTAMSAIVATAQKGTEFKAMLNDMGFDVMLQVSGSTSTLLGAFFLGMSDHASGTELDAAGVKAMFAGGLGAKAALAGAASTVEMKANFGRARNYGERSIGYADSGATSWSCMFESFAQAL